uniref:Si:dkey-29b11.3 n=1 Tax=Cyclopterus lumpus TaxID=8103 RepID=A0A8C2WY85_CYCLU
MSEDLISMQHVSLMCFDNCLLQMPEGLWRLLSKHDGRGITVEFGKLFEHYVTISNKLVGVLLRARKQGLVDFEGEMLWQGKDDHAVITLMQ